MRNIFLLFCLIYACNSMSGVVIPDRDPSTGQPVQTSKPFAADNGYRVRATGIAGSVGFGTTGNVDYKLTEARMINGVDLILSGHCVDDTVDFQVVDVDNVLGFGNNFVIDQFGTNWNVSTSQDHQGQIVFTYGSLIPANIYIRVKYTNTCASGTSKVKANLFLHKAP